MPDFFAALIAAPIAYAALHGKDPDPLIRASGVSSEVLTDPDARVSYDALIGLWNHLVHDVFAGEPMGIPYGQWLGFARQGAFGLLIQHSPSLRVWLRRFGRLQHIADPYLMLEAREEAGRDVLILDNTPFARELIEPMEMFMVLAHDSIQDLFDRQVHPRSVSMAHAQKHDDQIYEDAFGCPVTFGAPVYSISFDAGVLDRPIEGAQEPIGHYVTKYLESLNIPLPHASPTQAVDDRVVAWIEDHLPDGPTHHGAADALGLSVRTLQRKLSQQGTTFSKLLERARRARALHYLEHSALPIAEIAFLVGYSTRTSFYRAFKSWTGRTPEDTRRGLAG